MSSSYLNMAAGAFLGTCFVAMTLSIVSGSIYYSPNPEKEGFVIKAEKTAAGGAAQPPSRRSRRSRRCCRRPTSRRATRSSRSAKPATAATRAGRTRSDPICGTSSDRPIASHPGFSYSSALKKFSDGSKKKWTYERLNHWLHDPRGYVSGTAMTFPGVKDNQDRADVIAYLHTLSDNPVPFPKPEAANSEKAAAGGKGAPAADKGKASAEQSSKPGTAPASKAPAKDAANAGSKEPAQNAAGQKPQSQGANDQSAPATQKPAVQKPASNQ